MRNRITKQVKQELKQILDSTGYWSEQTKEYLSSFEYYTAQKLHSMAQAYCKYNQEF